jgi:hypothetical protein
MGLGTVPKLVGCHADCDNDSHSDSPQLAWAWSKKKELIAWSSMAIVFMVRFVPFGVAPMAVFGVTWVPFQIILGLVWAGRAIALILVIPTLLAFFFLIPEVTVV